MEKIASHDLLVGSHGSGIWQIEDFVHFLDIYIRVSYGSNISLIEEILHNFDFMVDKQNIANV